MSGHHLSHSQRGMECAGLSAYSYAKTFLCRRLGKPTGGKGERMAEFISVQTTFNSKEGAQKIAEAIVRRRLAACAQVSGPITSTYWWEGKLEQSEEWVCTAKTRKEL